MRGRSRSANSKGRHENDSNRKTAADKGQLQPRAREHLDAAAKAGRSEDSITLLAATKTVCAEDILFAVDSLGITHIGENRTEEMCAKFDALRGHAKIHQIGTLQRRKVRTIADKADLIESVDSIPLAAEIDKRFGALGRKIPVLVEINSGREAAKSGIMPEDAPSFVDELEQFSSIEVAGLMTMAPVCEKIDEYRKYFSETYRIIYYCRGPWLFRNRS